MTELEILDQYRDGFLDRVERPSAHDCWNWFTNRKVHHGQVGLKKDGSTFMVANVMWYYVYGTYPNTTFRRSCGNPRCVNPVHLYSLDITGHQPRFSPGEGIDHMSMYCEVKTQFRNRDALIQALVETGPWKQEQIEVHDQAVNLVGYHGDTRSQTAHVIVRREHIGSASNDIGFERMPDGSFVARISEYDSNRFGTAWLNQLKGNYAYHVIARQQMQKGRQVQRTRLPDGRQRVTVIANR